MPLEPNAELHEWQSVPEPRRGGITEPGATPRAGGEGLIPSPDGAQ